MTICCIPGCGNALTAHARLRACAACRASLHSWEQRRTAEILERAVRLRKFSARIASIVVIADDYGMAQKAGRESLRTLIEFPSKRRARR